jgi:hypothetical protein
MTTDPFEVLRDAETYLSALHNSVARHDNLGADFTCHGCQLREQITAALAEPAAPSAPADRATEWREAADAIVAEFPGPDLDRYTRYGADFLRRKASEARQTEPRPPITNYVVEIYDADEWLISNARTDDLDSSRAKLRGRRNKWPDMPLRIVRSVETYTVVEVDDPQAPECGAELVPRTGTRPCVLPAGHSGTHHQDKHTNRWPIVEQQAGERQPCGTVSPDGDYTCALPARHDGFHAEKTLESITPNGSRMIWETPIVAYRNPNDGPLYCTSCGHGEDGVEPLTSEDLPDGGLCADCGVDVLIPQAGESR